MFASFRIVGEFNQAVRKVIRKVRDWLFGDIQKRHNRLHPTSDVVGSDREVSSRPAITFCEHNVLIFMIAGTGTTRPTRYN